MTPETKLKTAVLARLKADGWYPIKISDRFRKGTLDLYAVRPPKHMDPRAVNPGQRGTRHLWLELKRPGAEPTALQRDEIKNLRLHGAEAYKINSTADLDRILAVEP